MEEIIWLEFIKLKGIHLINNFRNIKRKKGNNKKRHQKKEEISLIVCCGENLTNQDYSRNIFLIDQGNGNINKKFPLSLMKDLKLSFTIYPSLLNTLEISGHDLIEKASENEGIVRIGFIWLQDINLAKETTKKSTKKIGENEKKEKKKDGGKEREDVVLELEVIIEVEKRE